jgi:hypothetical protein
LIPRTKAGGDPPAGVGRVGRQRREPAPRHPGTVQALPGILDDLERRGLWAITAGRVFG